MTMVVPFRPAVGPYHRADSGSAPSEVLGRQVIVENVGGAGGINVGPRGEGGARRLPDHLRHQGTHALNQMLYKKPLYDGAVDFAPVAMVANGRSAGDARTEGAVCANSSNTRGQPDKAAIWLRRLGSITHLACLLLNPAIGIDAAHVPYRGSGLSIQDIIAGRMDYACPIPSIGVPHVKGSRVKAIASS